MGAEDSYISSQFQKHFLEVGSYRGIDRRLRGYGYIFHSRCFCTQHDRNTNVDQVEALFGGFAMSWIGYLIILIISIAIAFLTGFISRSIVFRHLQRLN